MNPVVTEILLITLFSGLGGWWLSAGKTTDKPVRIMLFVGYFWLLAFIQLVLAGLGYFVWRH
ncbi:MAG: hypothetical protein ABSB19_15970 [Methylomonas sp.]|jgi:hypothetical protein